MSKTRLVISATCAIVIIVLLLVACAQPGPSPTGTAPAPATKTTPETAKPKPIVWRMVTNYKATDQLSVPLQEFARKVAEQTGGRLTIDLYYGDALMKLSDFAAAVIKGEALQIANVSVTGTADVIPEYNIFALPVLGSNIREGATYFAAVSAALEQSDFEQRRGIIYMGTEAGSGSCLWSSRRVVSLEDLKGMKVRAYNDITAKATQNLGAVPSTIVVSELYVALQRKTVDAAWTSFESGGVSLNLWDVQKFFLAFPIVFGFQSTIANRAAFYALPQDIQKIVRTLGKEANAKQQEVSLKGDSEARGVLKQKGMEVNELSPTEAARWSAKVVSLWDEFVAKAGPSGPELLKVAQKSLGR